MLQWGVRCRCLWLAAVPALGGCGDEVVGVFGTTDDRCTVVESFESGAFPGDAWLAWNELDSSHEAHDGVLRFHPATEGLYDTGLVLLPPHRIDASVGVSYRVRVLTPPADPGVLFYATLLDDTGADDQSAFAGYLLGQELRAEVRDGGGNTVEEQTFAGLAQPGWLGLRLEGDTVTYEASTDGVVWTDLAVHTAPDHMDEPAPLLMVQTLAPTPTPSVVEIDDVQVCEVE